MGRRFAPRLFQLLGLTPGEFRLATVFGLVPAFTAIGRLGTCALPASCRRGGLCNFGSSENAAALVGIKTKRVVFSVFTLTGVLTGLAAAMNAVRFHQVPSNAGLGLEMKVIAAVVVGGAAISGGSGTVLGTLLGVILLGSIGTSLTFLGISAYWEKAVQGAIILIAVAISLAGRNRD